MSVIGLTQDEADALLTMPKHRIDDQEWLYPTHGGNLSIELFSSDKREHFLLDISRGQINLTKTRYQNRARRIFIVARLELNGPRHRNPDGTWVECPHLHLYKEGYADRWAYPISETLFGNLRDPFQTLDDFMAFCNIVDPPKIQKGLFT